MTLLRAMNRNPHASVTELAREANLPRTTAYRLLDTLMTQGFVASLAGGGFTLTAEVRSLSDGFIDELWIDTAWREMVGLSSNLIWPVSLFTPEPPTMVIRRTTHELSAMSIDYGMSGRRLPISETAAGRAYLAFCPPAERELMLAMPGAYLSEPSALDRRMLSDRLEQVREQGYETRLGGVVPRTGSVSVPILTGHRATACLSLIFIAAGFSLERAIAEFVPPLRQAAARIASA